MVGLAVGESVPVGEVLFSELQLQRVALVLFLFEGKEIHLIVISYLETSNISLNIDSWQLSASDCSSTSPFNPDSLYQDHPDCNHQQPNNSQKPSNNEILDVSCLDWLLTGYLILCFGILKQSRCLSLVDFHDQLLFFKFNDLFFIGIFPHLFVEVSPLVKYRNVPQNVYQLTHTHTLIVELLLLLKCNVH